MMTRTQVWTRIGERLAAVGIGGVLGLLYLLAWWIVEFGNTGWPVDPQ
jgi:hypothetical protein